MRLLLAAVMVLAGCGEVRDTPPQEPAEIVVKMEHAAVGVVPPACKKASADWLRQRPAAEGSILHTFEVSKARRTQIEQLNDQLNKITAALKRGCLEAP